MNTWPRRTTTAAWLSQPITVCSSCLEAVRFTSQWKNPAANETACYLGASTAVQLNQSQSQGRWLWWRDQLSFLVLLEGPVLSIHVSGLPMQAFTRRLRMLADPPKRSRPSNGRTSQLSRWALLKPDSQPWLRTTWEQNGGQGEGGPCQCMRFHSIPVPGDVDHPCGQGPAYKHSKCLSLPLRHLSHIECHHLIDCDALYWT